MTVRGSSSFLLALASGHSGSPRAPGQHQEYLGQEGSCGQADHGVLELCLSVNGHAECTRPSSEAAYQGLSGLRLESSGQIYPPRGQTTAVFHHGAGIGPQSPELCFYQISICLVYGLLMT